MEQKNAGISRRSFLTGAAAAGAIASLGLAGCAPKASSEKAATTATANAATSEDWLGSAPDISNISETKETDILIVGAGMSGIMAAATAADLGLKFIVTDKGSDVAAAHYDFGAINSKFTTAQGLSVDKGRLLNEMNRYASFKNDSHVTRTWIDNSAELVEWLQGVEEKQLGATVNVTVDVENGGDGRAGGTNYYMPPECHHFTTADGNRIEHTKVLTDFIKAKGYDVNYSYDLQKLIREGDKSGRVTGAIFKTDGGYVQINASKGVVLACGGYAANPDMVKARNPIVPKCVTSLNYNQNNTGAGIKAAAWIGAALDTTSAAMIFDRGVVAPGVDAGYDSNNQFATNGQFNLGSQPFLKVDRKGERITNESANYDAICHAASNHPGGVWCQVFDVNAPADVQVFKTQGCSAMTWQMQLKGKTVDEAYNDKYISKGLMMKADTLDELATKLGFEGDAKKTFLASVERYNQLFDAGSDDDMGKEAYRLSAIRQAPFYGAWYGGSLLTTIDGVRINKHTQVLDKKGEVIEGLHAVGTCSGSFYSGNYPVYIVGDCLGRNTTFGRYSVRYLAGQIK